MRGPVWAWGIRARPGTALTIALLSAAAVATAVSGPLLLRGVEQSAVSTAVGTADSASTALTVSTDIQPGDPIEGLEAAEQAALAVPTTRLFLPPVTVVESVGALSWTRRSEGVSATKVPTRHSRIAVQDNDCRGVHFLSGRCPTAATEVAVASGDAARFALPPGTGIDVSVPFGQGLTTQHLTVSGTYDAGSPGLAVTTPTSVGAAATGVSATDLMVSPRSSAWPFLANIAVTRRALRTGVTVGDLPTLRGSIAAVQRDSLAQTGTLAVDQHLADLLAGIDRESRDAKILIWVIELQALALALGALAIVLQRFARARAREWGVGRLRGLKLRTWLVTVFAEPVLPLVAGLPVGILLGVGCARLAATAALRDGTPIEPWREPVVLSAVLAVIGSLVVLVGASVRTATVDLAQLLGEVTEERRTSRAAAVAQSVAVLLAVVSTYQLLAGGQLTSSEGRLGLLAPALLSVAVVVVAVQVAGWRARRSASSPARGLATLVVVRQLGRTPSTLLRSVMVTVGVALVVFTTQLAWASATNQDLLADASVGAGQVLTVQIPAGADLREIVDAADPSGTQAMAVEELAGDVNGGVSRVVAVDTSRLSRVSSWRSAWSGLTAAHLVSALSPPVTPPVQLLGGRIDLTVTGVSSVAGPLAQGVSDLPEPTVSLTVQSKGHWLTMPLGPLVKPSERLSAAIPCTQGCRLVSLTTGATQDSPYDATYTVSSLSTDLTPASSFDALLHRAGHWQSRVGPIIDPSRPGYATATPTPDGLVVKAHDATGDQTPGIEPTDRPDPLPALVGPATQTSPFPGVRGAVRGTGLNGQAQLIRPVGRPSVLPRALAEGVVVDLVAAQRLSDPSQRETLDEVWLTKGPHRAVEAALAHAGVRIVGRANLDVVRQAVSGQAPTRATTVVLTVALLAALLVVAGLCAARWLDAPARQRDWRSLRVAGLTAGRIRRLAAAEIAGPALLALLVGVAAGSVSYLLSVRRLPIRLGDAGPPIEIGPSWPALGLVATAGAVVLVSIAAVSAWLELRGLTGEGQADG